MAKTIKVGDKVDTIYGEEVEIVKVEPEYGRLVRTKDDEEVIIREGTLMYLTKGKNGNLCWFPPKKIK